MKGRKISSEISGSTLITPDVRPSLGGTENFIGLCWEGFGEDPKVKFLIYIFQRTNMDSCKQII